MQNISQILRAPKYSNSLVADGLSRVLIVANYDKTLEFSIARTSNVDSGSLDSVYGLESSNDTNHHKSNSITADPINFKNHRQDSVVVVYEGPCYIRMTREMRYVPVEISVSNVKNHIHERIMIKVYRVPVILVHGVWSTPSRAWEETNFKQSLEANGFQVSMVDYTEHNAKTFDPYAEREIGNQSYSCHSNRRYVMC